MTVADQPRENGESRKNRFSFYTPDEVNHTDFLQVSKIATQTPALTAPAKQPERFNLFNTDTLEQAAQYPDPRSPAHSMIVEVDVARTRTRTRVEAPVHQVIDPMSPDSSEILRSLQETEDILKIPKQRVGEPRIPPSGNPYEHAILDALNLLRAKNACGDAVLRSRFSEVDDSGVEHNWENKMEQYVIKIKEQHQKPTLATDSLNVADFSAMSGKIYRHHAERFIPPRSKDNSPDPTRAHSTSAGRSIQSVTTQEEVQKGVERVLMAILEHAQDDNQNDGLANALDDLLSVDTRSLHSQELIRGVPPSRRDSQEQSDDEQSQKRSVVEELLAEADETNITSTLVLSTPSSTVVEAQLSPQSTFSMSAFSKMNVNEDVISPPTPYLQDSDETLEVMLGPMAVLGPLSKRAGGTTGVVLEPSPSSPLCHADDDVLSDTASSFLDSLSLAVKDAENFVAYIASTVSLDGTKSESKPVSASKKDKYTTQAEDGEDNDSEDSNFDHEANELMRSLCTHLLPYGVDQSTKHLTEIPPWDESNPNEPGYRIIRLSKLQLKRVETQFENMVNGFKQKSERHLDDKKTHFDVSVDWNGMSDPNFERDLEEAEELLDQEEKRLQAVNAVNNKSLSSQESVIESEDSTSESDSSDDSDELVESDGDDATLNCHPDFPGVRGAGKGEMGDLEYFYLPIIYKSHVTGFEPTKDMHLEPGNVVAGQYLVESELGSAAFSTAYRCIDLNSDTTGTGEYHDEVCLKVIKNTKDFFDQSLDEIKILELLRQTGRCQEKFIIEMKTFFYHREHLVIVTELLRQNLFEFGKFIVENNEEPYFTLKRLCYITRQCLLALEFVHGLGLVHSDIKPENILLSSYSRAMIKIIDFGSSCYLTDRQSSYIQSRSYRAPEVILGLPYNGKIDIWSLGCVVCEMFTGEVTFQNDSIVSMLSRIEAICGAFPRHMIAQGRQSGRFFSKSGLLYEVVDNDEKRSNPTQDEDEQGFFDVFQPKRTTMAARLGFDPEKVALRLSAAAHEQALFVSFCKAMLTIDPDSRLSATEALKHPWIVSGEALTELDIKYPSS